jgi:hypothetical protein
VVDTARGGMKGHGRPLRLNLTQAGG